MPWCPLTLIPTTKAFQHAKPGAIKPSLGGSTPTKNNHVLTQHACAFQHTACILPTATRIACGAGHAQF